MYLAGGLSKRRINRLNESIEAYVCFEGARLVSNVSQAGYDMPQIVFWNLWTASSSAVPASASDAGVALVSGYNASLLKVFMDGTDADWTMGRGGGATDVLDTILASERYENIVCVVD